MAQILDDDELVSPDETAKMLDVTPGTLAVWRCHGKYPELTYTKTGKKVKYFLSGIRARIKNGTVEAA